MACWPFTTGVQEFNATRKCGGVESSVTWLTTLPMILLGLASSDSQSEGEEDV